MIFIWDPVLNVSNINKFKNNLSNFSWDEITNNQSPDTSYKMFFNVLNENFNSCFPEQKIKNNRKNHAINPWFSKGLLISRNTKNKLASKLISKPTTDNKIKYKFYNSIYNKLVKKAKIMYYDFQFKTHFSNIKNLVNYKWSFAL